MGARLSVNLNKVALVRNSRGGAAPDLLAAARTAIGYGAQGITVHPRPDLRHVRPGDVLGLAELLREPEYQSIEFNVEGNPYAGAEGDYPGFMELVREARPDQCTLVPDSPEQLTSDHGWVLDDAEMARLAPIVKALKGQGCRVSCFMDPVPEQFARVRQLGIDRIELYTGPYADAYGTAAGGAMLQRFAEAGRAAGELGLGVNAGHDLSRENLGDFCRVVPGVLEVSIGHALISEALWEGLGETVRGYRRILDGV